MDKMINKEQFEKDYLNDYAEICANPSVDFDAVFNDIKDKQCAQGVSNIEYYGDEEDGSYKGTYEFEEKHYGDNGKSKIAFYNFDVDYNGRDDIYTFTYRGL